MKNKVLDLKKELLERVKNGEYKDIYFGVVEENLEGNIVTNYMRYAINENKIYYFYKMSEYWETLEDWVNGYLYDIGEVGYKILAFDFNSPMHLQVKYAFELQYKEDCSFKNITKQALLGLLKEYE